MEPIWWILTLWSGPKKDWSRLKIHSAISWVTTKIVFKRYSLKANGRDNKELQKNVINLQEGKNGERYKEEMQHKKKHSQMVDLIIPGIMLSFNGLNIPSKGQKLSDRKRKTPL